MNRLRWNTVLPVLVAVVWGCTGCTGSLVPEAVRAPAAIVVTIPPLPGEYAGMEVVWTVRWWDGSGVAETVVTAGSGKEVRLDAAISAAGAEVIVVSAEPTLISPGVTLRPFGGWARAPAYEIALEGAKGVLADVVLDVSCDGLDPSLVNLERMQEAIEREYRYGARRIDRTRLEEGLRSTEFRTYHIRPAETAILEVRISAGSMNGSSAPWITDDQNEPLCPAVPAGAYTVWAFPIVPGTVRHAWRRGPSGEIQKMALTMSVEGHGRYTIYAVPSGTDR